MAAYQSRILLHRLHRFAAQTRASWSAGQVIALFVLALTGVAALAIVPDRAEAVPTLQVLRELANPLRAAEALTRAAGVEERYWREERIRRGDTLGRVLARLGVDDPEALAFVRVDPSARPLYRLRPGKPLRVEIDADGRLAALRFVANSGELLSIARDGTRFTTTSAPLPIEIRWEAATGEIRSSLFATADAIGLPDSVTSALAEVFAADIDFYHDLRQGDRFSVVYEMRYLDGEAIGAGRIVAAEFVNRGVTSRAYLWHDGNGIDAYYGDNGTPARKAFLRAPLEFSRIASGFSAERYHPILQTWRAHKGVDFAAPAGTPVRATGNGIVRSVGGQLGYGNVIELQHQGAFSTLYAHLSRFSPRVKRGAHVAQGEVIGYVGQTGWATGPHLHYEFRVAHEQRDPLKVVLPPAPPLMGAERRTFAAAIEPVAAQLAMARAYSTTIAAR